MFSVDTLARLISRFVAKGWVARRGMREERVRFRDRLVTHKEVQLLLGFFFFAKVLNLFISRHRASRHKMSPGPRCLPGTKKAFIRETPLAANFFFSLPRPLSSSSFLVFERMRRNIESKFSRLLKTSFIRHSLWNVTYTSFPRFRNFNINKYNI